MIACRSKLCRADLKALASEVRILKGIQCENVVHLYECFDEAPLCYLVTELCSGGELFDRIVKKKTYTEACAREAVHQVLNGVAFLHSHNVVHRDLKPENVMLSSKTGPPDIRVVDFGLSCIYTKDGARQLHRLAGTPYYMAPEILGKARAGYGPACDLWSCGVVLYILLCGYPPFWGDRDQDIFRKVRSGGFCWWSWCSAHPPCGVVVAPCPRH